MWVQFAIFTRAILASDSENCFSCPRASVADFNTGCHQSNFSVNLPSIAMFEGLNVAAILARAILLSPLAPGSKDHFCSKFSSEFRVQSLKDCCHLTGFAAPTGHPHLQTCLKQARIAPDNIENMR